MFWRQQFARRCQLELRQQQQFHQFEFEFRESQFQLQLQLHWQRQKRTETQRLARANSSSSFPAGRLATSVRQSCVAFVSCAFNLKLVREFSIACQPVGLVKSDATQAARHAALLAGAVSAASAASSLDCRQMDTSELAIPSGQNIGRPANLTLKWPPDCQWTRSHCSRELRAAPTRCCQLAPAWPRSDNN